MASVENKLSLSEKLGYGLGDAAANFVLQMRLNFLTIFYTDVYGIAPTTIALLQFGSHVIDGCNDIVMGILSDRTQTRFGKYRPWIFWSAIPLGAASFLIFAAPDFGSTGRVVYAAITLVAMIIAYGANNVPYSALGGVISDDPDERVGVASWRMGFAMLAALLVLRYTQGWIEHFGAGNPAVGYRTSMAIWASLAVFCSITTFFMTRERIVLAETHRASLREELSAVFANRAWQILAVASFLIYISQGMRGSVTVYFFQYAVQRKELFGDFHAVGMIGAIIGIFLSSALTERFGKRNAFCGGLAISSLMLVPFYFLSGEQAWLILGLQLAYQIVFGATVPIMWGMIADVADFNEWQNGRRSTAFTFAATLFFFKIGQGIGQALTPYILKVVGYVPNAVQPSEAVHGIRIMFSVMPAVLFLFAGVVLLGYVITKSMEQEMTAELRSRREKLTADGIEA